MDAAEVIAALGLAPLLPEGGFVRETWRSDGSSAIYYLVEAPDFSGLHRLAHVEVWAWHAGSPLRMLLLGPDGEIQRPVLGPDIGAGEQPQVVVPPGWWQAAEPAPGGAAEPVPGARRGWTLVSTFMAPPYGDDVITFGAATELSATYPAAAEEIGRLSRA